MDRRALLRGLGVGLIGGLTGCQALPFTQSTVSPRWQRDYNRVEDVHRFEGWLYLERGTPDTGAIAVDPADGRIVWRCGWCWRVDPGRTWLYITGHPDGEFAEPMVTAYSLPRTREWRVSGEFATVLGDTVLIWTGRRTPTMTEKLWGVARDGSTVRWRYAFTEDIRWADTVRHDGVSVLTVEGDPPRTWVYDLAEGRARWRQAIAVGWPTNVQMVDDTLYLGTEHDSESTPSTVTAIESAGTYRWQREWAGIAAFPMYADEHRVVTRIAGGDTGPDRTVAVGTATGRTEWRTDDRLVGIRDGGVYTLDDWRVARRAITDGTVESTIDLAGIVDADVVDRTWFEFHDSLLYIVMPSAVIVVDVDDAVERWRFTVDGAIRDVSVFPETVYVTTEDAVAAVPRSATP